MLGILMVWEFGILLYVVIGISMAIFLYSYDYRVTKFRLFLILLTISFLLLITTLSGYFGSRATSLEQAVLLYKIFSLSIYLSLALLYLVPRKGVSRKYRKYVDTIYIMLVGITLYDHLFFNSIISRNNGFYTLIRDNSPIGLVSSITTFLLVFSTTIIVLKKNVKNSIIKQRIMVTKYLVILYLVASPIYPVIKLLGYGVFGSAMVLSIFLSILWLLTSLIIQINPYIFLFSPIFIKGILISIPKFDFEIKHSKDEKVSELLEETKTIQILTRSPEEMPVVSRFKIDDLYVAVLESKELTIVVIGEDIDKDTLTLLENIGEQFTKIVENFDMKKVVDRSRFYLETEQIIKKIF